jgi:TonB family protein
VTLVAALLLAQMARAEPTPDPLRYLLIDTRRTGHASMPTRVLPKFPAELRATEQVTTVLVDVVVDPQGRVTRAGVDDSMAHVTARLSALRAAADWRFPPAIGESSRELQLSFTYRTLPATTSLKDLNPDYPGPYRVEVRARALTPGEEHLAPYPPR